MKKIIKSTKFDNCECNFKLKGGPKPPRITTNDLANKLNDVMNSIKELDSKLTARLDNLVSKNNLKE